MAFHICTSITVAFVSFLLSFTMFLSESDEAFWIEHNIVIDAPIEFVWEHHPKSVDVSKCMMPYGPLGGVEAQTPSEDFNEAGSTITYVLTGGATLVERILKRDSENHHYQYDYVPPSELRPFVKVMQGNFFFTAMENGKTHWKWRYWLAPQSKLCNIPAWMIKRFLFTGYTGAAKGRFKKVIEDMYKNTK